MSAATDPQARALALYEAHLPWFEHWIAKQRMAASGLAVHDRILGLHALYQAAQDWVAQTADVREEHFVDFAQGRLIAAFQAADRVSANIAEKSTVLSVWQEPRDTQALARQTSYLLAEPLSLPRDEVGSLGGLLTHWRMLLGRYWALILSLVLVFECGIAALTLTVPPTYLASTTLNTGMGRRDPLSGGGDWFTQGVAIANITELLKSRSVLQETLESLKWPQSPEDLQKRITITRLGQAGFLRIDAEAEGAADAANLANTLVRVFLDIYASHQSSDARSNQAFFIGQVRVARQRLDRAEGALRAFRARALPELHAAVPQRVNDLLSQREEALSTLSAAEAGLKSLQEQWRQLQNSPEAKRALVHQGTLDTPLERVRELENNLQDAREIYGPRADIVKLLTQQLTRARQGLAVARDESESNRPAFAETRTRLAQLRTDVAMARARLQAIDRSLATWQPQAGLAGTQQVTHEQLAREVKVAETQYLELQAQLGQSRLQAQGAQNLPISVIDPATAPEQPTSNKLALKLALGAPVALALGLGLAHFLARPRRRRTHDPKDVPAGVDGHAAEQAS